MYLACLLDPCFKDRFLSGTTQQVEVKKMLLEELEKSDVGSLEPPSKWPNAYITELQRSFNDILEKSGPFEGESTVIGSVVE